jgi:hypothetical protein
MTVRTAQPTPCAGNCPDHPVCEGLLVVRRSVPDPASDAAGDRANARCGRCGAVFSWDGSLLTYLGTHEPPPTKAGWRQAERSEDTRRRG